MNLSDQHYTFQYMRTILTSLALVLIMTSSIAVRAQDTLSYNIIDGQAELSAIINVPNTTKDVLFKKATEWVYKTYVSGDAVIDIADPETSKINAKGLGVQLVYKNSFVKVEGGRFKYGFTIYAKDNKAKIVFDRITHLRGEMLQMKDGSNYADEFPSAWGSFGKSQSKKQWLLMKQQALLDFNELYASFKKYLVTEDRNANF